MTDKTGIAETSLLDLLANVPEEAHAWRQNHHIPFGRLCKQAKKELEQKYKQIAALEKVVEAAKKEIYDGRDPLGDYWSDFDEALGLFKTYSFPMIRFVIDESIAKGKVYIIQDGKLVGKIVGLEE